MTSNQKLRQNIPEYSRAMRSITKLKSKQYGFKRDGQYALLNSVQDVEAMLFNLVLPFGIGAPGRGYYGVYGSGINYGVYGANSNNAYDVYGVSSSDYSANGSSGVYGTGAAYGTYGIASGDFTYGSIGLPSISGLTAVAVHRAVILMMMFSPAASIKLSIAS